MRLVLLVVAVVSVACSSSLMAQDVAYGAKAGVNFATANFEGELRVEVERRVGVAAGGFVWLPIGGRVGLVPVGHGVRHSRAQPAQDASDLWLR